MYTIHGNYRVAAAAVVCAHHGHALNHGWRCDEVVLSVLNAIKQFRILLRKPRQRLPKQKTPVLAN